MRLLKPVQNILQKIPVGWVLSAAFVVLYFANRRWEDGRNAPYTLVIAAGMLLLGFAEIHLDRWFARKKSALDADLQKLKVQDMTRDMLTALPANYKMPRAAMVVSEEDVLAMLRFHEFAEETVNGVTQWRPPSTLGFYTERLWPTAAAFFILGSHLRCQVRYREMGLPV